MACSVEGCSSEVAARGLCKGHLHKLYKYGDPTIGRRRTDRGYGAGHVDRHGYRVISQGKNAHKREHIIIAEKALGGPLPPEVVVHHVDEDRSHNANTNLVICPDRAYHNLLHQRMKARDACGNPNWRKCCRCLVYDDPANMTITTKQAYHKACNAAHQRALKEKQNG